MNEYHNTGDFAVTLFRILYCDTCHRYYAAIMTLENAFLISRLQYFISLVMTNEAHNSHNLIPVSQNSVSFGVRVLIYIRHLHKRCSNNYINVNEM